MSEADVLMKPMTARAETAPPAPHPVDGDPDLTPTLRRVATMLDVSGAMLLRLDMDRGGWDLLAQVGSPQVAAGGGSDWRRLAERASIIGRQPARDRSSRFECWSCNHVLSLAIRADAASMLLLVLSRSADGPDFDAEDRRSAAACQEWLGDMLLIWWRCQGERAVGQGLRVALDVSGVGMLLLDGAAQIVFANAQAREILERADGLYRAGRAISAAELEDAIRLQTVIHHHMRPQDTGAEKGAGWKDVTRASIVPIRRGGGHRSLIVAVSGIGQRAPAIHEPAVILHLLDPETDARHDIGPVCGIYGLTSSEARLTQHIVMGATLAEAALQMRIQPETARFYLKQVFQKTGVNRQADLVRLVLNSLVRTRRGIALSII